MQRQERIAKRIEDETTPIRRYTKGEIAKRLGLSRAALGRRINDGKWRYDQLETLAKLFNTTVADLVGDNNNEDGAA